MRPHASALVLVTLCLVVPSGPGASALPTAPVSPCTTPPGLAPSCTAWVTALPGMSRFVDSGLHMMQVDDGAVYALAQGLDGNPNRSSVTRLDASGHVVWQVEAPRFVYQMFHAPGSKTVILGPGLSALDAATGAVTWKRTDMAWPLAVSKDGKTVLAPWWDGSRYELAAVSAKTGQVIWTRADDGVGALTLIRAAPWPDGTLYLAAGRHVGSQYTVELLALNMHNGAVKWIQPQGTQGFDTLLVDASGRHLYDVGGYGNTLQLSRIAASTGKVEWSRTYSEDSLTFGRPPPAALDEGTGHLVVGAAAFADSSPFGNAPEVVAFDAATGATAWRSQLESAVDGSGCSVYDVATDGHGQVAATGCKDTQVTGGAAFLWTLSAADGMTTGVASDGAAASTVGYEVAIQDGNAFVVAGSATTQPTVRDYPLPLPSVV